MSRSSTKDEYRAMVAAAAEAMWLHHFTDAIDLPPFRPKIYFDNESTICVTKNPVLHDPVKMLVLIATLFVNSS